MCLPRSPTKIEFKSTETKPATSEQKQSNDNNNNKQEAAAAASDTSVRAIEDVLAELVQKSDAAVLSQVKLSFDWHAKFNAAEALPNGPEKYKLLTQISSDFVAIASAYGLVL